MANLEVIATTKPFWQFRAASDEPGVGELLLYGEISDMTWFGDEVTPKQFKEDLDALGGVDEIRVYINSAGGDLFAGLAIYNMLRRHEAEKTVYVDGLAASAASVVAMVGDTVRMPRNAMLMIHNPWVFALGDSVHLRKVADNLDKARIGMLDIYASKTGMTAEEIIPLLDAETWLTADEAVEMGFADEVEESKEIAASLSAGRLVVNGVAADLSRYRNTGRVQEILGGRRVVAQVSGSSSSSGGTVNVTLNVSVTGGVARPQAGVVPTDVSRETAPENTPWEAPTLSDFTDESWEDLSDSEKREITGHYAWAPEMPPERFSDLKLPHHRPSDGAVVWNGVRAAAQRLEQSDIPDEDLPRVKAHLASHYRQFDKTPPWEDQAASKVLPLSLYERRLRVRRHERRGA